MLDTPLRREQPVLERLLALVRLVAGPVPPALGFALRVALGLLGRRRRLVVRRPSRRLGRRRCVRNGRLGLVRLARSPRRPRRGLRAGGVSLHPPSPRLVTANSPRARRPAWCGPARSRPRPLRLRPWLRPSSATTWSAGRRESVTLSRTTALWKTHLGLGVAVSRLDRVGSVVESRFALQPRERGSGSGTSRHERTRTPTSASHWSSLRSTVRKCRSWPGPIQSNHGLRPIVVAVSIPWPRNASTTWS